MKNLIKLLSVTFLVTQASISCLLAQDRSIGQSTVVFTDESRGRKLITELWYLTDEQRVLPVSTERSVFKLYPAIQNAKPLSKKFPLVLLSHGTGGGRHTMAWLATALAKEGYLVAAVDHWGNTWDNPIPENFIKFWERPTDISFILSGLLNDAFWSKYIDENNVGAIGFSLGGYTVISAAGGIFDYERFKAFTRTEQGKREAEIPEMPGLLDRFKGTDFTDDYNSVKNKLHDQRIKCVVALSPALGRGFDEKGLSGIAIPVLIIGAESDIIAPPKTNALHYAAYILQSKAEILENPIGHYVFLNECTAFGKEAVEAICNDDKNVDRHGVHHRVINSVQSFLNSNLK